MSGAVKIVQMNPRAGRIDENLEEIISQIKSAPDGALVVFPEYALTGWPLGDLADSEEFIEKSIDATVTLERFMRANAEHDRSAILGYLDHSEDGGVSSIAVLGGGTRLKSAAFKIVMFGGKRVGVVLKGDLDLILESPNLKSALTTGKITGLIILDSEIYEGQELYSKAYIKELLDDSNVEYCILANLAGAQDDVIFTGTSMLVRKAGTAAILKKFEEDSAIWDNNKIAYGTNGYYVGREDRESDLYHAAAMGVRDYVKKNNMKTILVGVSGGIDSALVVSIAADAIGGENVYGVSMPSQYSSGGSITDAEELMKNVGGRYDAVAISETFDILKDTLGLTGLAEENLQARIRGVILMGLSNQNGHLVLATGNKSETAMGYCTLYGDTVGGYAPISDLYKRDVYALAKWRNEQSDAPIPESSITKAPSAELRPGQIDQDSLPDYDLLDSFLFDHLENGMERKTLEFKYGTDLTEELLAKLDRSEWKRRQEPVGPKLSTFSFGLDRVVPITR